VIVADVIEGGAVGNELEVVSPFGPFDALAESAHRLYLDGYGEAAIAASREGLLFTELAGDERTARYLQFICGVALHQLGRAAEASEEAGHLLRRLGTDAEPVWRAKALALLAESRVDLGMTALAMDLAEGQLIVSAQPIRTYDHLSATMSVALALNALALFEPADELMVQMLALTFPPARVRLNVAQEAAVLQVAWGAMLEVAGRAPEAWPHYTVALARAARMRALAHEVGYPEMLARAEAIEAFVLQRTGQTDLAQGRLRPAMAAFRLREELAETQIARIAMAQARADAGDQTEAAELLAAVQRVSTSGASRRSPSGRATPSCATDAVKPRTPSRSSRRSRCRGCGRTGRAGSRPCRTASSSVRWPSSTSASGAPPSSTR
jgi:hypothetical protein